MKLSVAIVVVFLLGLLSSACSEAPQSKSSSKSSGSSVLGIDSQHKGCSIAADCVVFVNSCTGCGCGDAINVAFVALYQNELERVCSEPADPDSCDDSCPVAQVACQNNRCVISNN